MKDVFESFIAIRNLALMNCLIRMNLSLFTVKIFKKIDIKMFKVLNGENPPVENEIFCVRNEASYDFDKGRVFISLQLIPFSAVQKV